MGSDNSASTNELLLELIMEVRGAMTTFGKKLDSFDKKLTQHLADDAEWQSRLLKKVPALANGNGHGKGNGNGTGKRKPS